MKDEARARRFGERLRAARRHAGLTQKDVATKLGRSPAWLAGIEAGRRPIPVHEAKTLSTMLDVSLDDLAEERETMNTDYMILIEGEPGSYTSYAPDLPGVLVGGNTIDVVIELMRRAINLHIASLVRDGRPVPAPTVVAAAHIHVD